MSNQYQYIEDELLQLIDACGVALLLADRYSEANEAAVLTKLRHLKQFIPEAADHVWQKFRELPRRPIAELPLSFNGRPPVGSYCELVLDVAAAIELTFEMVPDESDARYWRSWAKSFVPRMIKEKKPEDIGFNVQRELRTVDDRSAVVAVAATASDDSPLWNQPGTPIPGEFAMHGPLKGTKSNLSKWIVGDGKSDPRKLQSWLATGIIWGRQEHRTLCAVWFNNGKTYSEANSRKIADER